MKKNYNFNYINRQTAQKADIEYSSLEVAICTAKVLAKAPIVDGKLWHTTDSDEFYYDWAGKRIKMNLTGGGEGLMNEINKIKDDVARLDPAKISKAVSDVETATQTANDAASLAQQAAAQVNDKVNASDLAAVATSGDYNDLENKPVIPSVNGLASETWVESRGYLTTTNQNFPQGWHKSGTMANLIADINADDTAVVGKTYIGTVSFNDLPVSTDDEWKDKRLVQGEMKVDIMASGGDGKVILFTLTSTLKPYHWEYESLYGNTGEWVSFLTSDDIAGGGADGADGKSAYELAVENGFSGTLSDWLDSLKGTDGQNGTNGINGQDGQNGVDGINGVDGLDGKDGKSAYELYLDSVSTDKEFLIVDHTNFAQVRHNELEDYYNNYPTEASQDGENWPPFTADAFPWVVVNHTFDGNTVLKLFYKGNEVLSYTPAAQIEREDGTMVDRTYAIIGVPSISVEFEEFTETVEGTDNLLDSNDFEVKLVSAADDLTLAQWLASLKGEKGDDADVEVLTGSFPADSDVEDEQAVVNGFATVQDVIDYVNALFEKKKDELIPVPVPYAYITGYGLNDTPTDITTFNPFELNETGVTEIEVWAPQELAVWDPSTNQELPSIKFTVDVPTGYTLTSAYLWNVLTNQYDLLTGDVAFDTNPRYTTRIINGVTYNSSVRGKVDDTGTNGLFKYKIVITKQ